MARLLTRFGLAGLANTAAGYAVILACLWAGLGDYLSNALGYLAGLMLSFALNRRFTFRVEGRASNGEMLRFGLAWAVAYAANLAVLYFGRTLVGEGNPLVQLPAIAAYTLVFFVLSARFVFPADRRAA